MADTVIKVISWFIPKRALIKFEGESESMTVSEAFIEKADFTKNPLLKGDSVEITVKGEEIVNMVKAEPAKEEKVEKQTKEVAKAEAEGKPVPEEKDKEVAGEEVTKEVFCVSPYGLKFAGDTNWTNFTDELKAKDMRSLGVIAHSTITVVINDGKITQIVKVEKVKEKSKEESASSTATTKKSSFRDEEATDKRTAVMSAKDVIVALINQKRPEVSLQEGIETAIMKLSKKFYEAIKQA